MRLLRKIEQYTIGFIFHWHLYKMLFLEFLPYFTGGVVVVMIFMGGNAVLFNMLEHIVNKHVPPAVYAKVLLLQMPAFLVMGLPMATIFGTLMAFGRMSKDNELDAMRTSRVVAWRILLFMVIVIGIPITALDWRLTHKVVPAASRTSLNLWSKYIFADITGKPMANVFFQGKEGTYFFISSFDPASGRLSGVTVYQTSNNNQYPQLLVAPYAYWNEQYVSLRKGRIYDIRNDGLLQFDSTFDDMRLNVQKHIDQLAKNLQDNIHAGAGDPTAPQKVNKEELMKNKSLESDLMFNLSMNMDEDALKKQIKVYKDFGMDTKALETNMSFKKSIPFSCLVCIVLATPISIGGARAGQGAMRNIVLILGLMTAYYISTIVAIALGHSGTIAPMYAAWLQNTTFCAIGLLLSLVYMKK